MNRDAQLKQDALAIFKAALDAVDPERLVHAALSGRAAELQAEGRVVLISFGKAAAAMARGAWSVLGDRLDAGIVVTPEATAHTVPPQFQTFVGGHPLPTEEGVRGAQAIRQLAAECGKSDLLLCLVSGGGSSMLTLPPDEVPLADIGTLTAQLLRAGTNIEELNTVRKQLDRLKGGRLAREAAPASVLALLISDVLGDRIDQIASGPISAGRTCFPDALGVLDGLGLRGAVPRSVRDYLELGLQGQVEKAPGHGDPCFDRVRAEVIGSGRTAAHAACEAARRLGYQTLMVSTSLSGEARRVGAFLADVARKVRMHGDPVAPPACIVTAGETTVTVRGDGVGGRNQELALGAALQLDGEAATLIASMGTDGIDGCTDAAGAIATGTTLARAREAGLDWQQALARNDSYPFFKRLDDLILTGPTGTNVADLQIVLVR